MCGCSEIPVETYTVSFRRRQRNRGTEIRRQVGQIVLLAGDVLAEEGDARIPGRIQVAETGVEQGVGLLFGRRYVLRAEVVAGVVIDIAGNLESTVADIEGLDRKSVV